MLFPMPMFVNGNEAFQPKLEIGWELENKEIRRKIFADKMTLVRRRKLEEEVRRKMMLGTPL